MSKVVVARFAEPERAEEALEKLLQTTSPPDVRSALVHKGRVDPLDLPDEATEVGRNIILAALIGAGMGLVGMVAVLAFVDIPGMGWGLGLVSGVFVGAAGGLLRAAVAGTRIPVSDIRALEPAVEERGQAIATVLVGNPDLLGEVENLLDEHGAAELFTI